MITRVSSSVRTNDSQPVGLFLALNLSLSATSGDLEPGKFVVFREGLPYPGDSISGKRQSRTLSREKQRSRRSSRSKRGCAQYVLNVSSRTGRRLLFHLFISLVLLLSASPSVSFSPSSILSVSLLNLYKRAVSAELVRASPPPMQRRASKSQYPALANVNIVSMAG